MRVARVVLLYCSWLGACLALAGPAAGDGILGLGSSQPADREKALGALEAALARDAKACVSVLPALRDILRTRGPLERARVARLLLRIPGDEALTSWWRVLDPDEETDDRVLAAAIDAAGDRRDDPAFSRRLVDASRDPRESPARRAVVLEALGLTSGPAAGLVLSTPRPGADWIEEACRALGLLRRGGRDSVPPLLALLAHADAAVRAHAWEGLVRITGQNLPPKVEVWAAWWKEHGAEPLPAAPPPVAEGARYAPPDPAHVPQYYGIPIRGKGETCRVVFCLDVSASMAKVGLERAQKGLEDAIRECTTKHEFDVVAFNDAVWSWAGRPVRAHPVQKARALAWVWALESKSQTNIYDAVELAFGEGGVGIRAVPDPVRLDAVYLLSDGAPNRGRYHAPSQVVKGIAALSEGRVPVHTIGAGESVFELLRDIATATGGTFVDALE